MTIRDFKNIDADFCYKTRSAAITQKFHKEIGHNAVNAVMYAYMPEDYIRMSEKVKIFIIENNSEKIGFVLIKKINNKTAEIPLIYFDLKHLYKGHGRKTMKFLEKWVKENWEKVNKIILDTIIPKYNSGFYKKVGYREAGESKCVFQDIELKAIRFEKII